MVSPGHLDCSGLFIYLLRFKDYHCVGSPPRMRERQMKQDSGIKAIGITPAYAGKTEAHSTTTSRVKDHPRVCGKDCKKYDVVSVSGGSPPRMRERRKRNRRILTKTGITPSYAGKTYRLVRRTLWR